MRSLINKYGKITLNKIKFIDKKKIENKQFLKSVGLCFIGTNHDVFKFDSLAKI